MAKASVCQVTVSGLATNPNANALPAGSCMVAENVVSRRPGTLEPCPASTALITVPAPLYTAGKGLWSDADNAVIAVLPNKNDDNEWVPGTDETQTGALACLTVNQETNSLDWTLDEMPIGLNLSTGVASYRDTGFLPGLTHSTYSHFRTLVNEKWAQIVSDGTGTGFRWAGLMPPQIRVDVSADAAGWLEDGNSVLYRAHFLIESTNTAQPFTVTGPVGTVTPAFTSDPLAVATVAIGLGSGEPLILNDAAYNVYVCLYRSTQDAVETMQDLPWDFRLVAQRRITLAALTAQTLVIEDRANEIARKSGEPLYTNANEEGENNNNFAPPVARDISVFRDTTFFANRSSFPARTVAIPGAYLNSATGYLLSDEDREHGIGHRYAGNANTVTNGSAVVTVSSASNFLGLAVGQEVNVGVGVNSLSSTIVSLGALSFTMAHVWPHASSGAAAVHTFDRYKMKIYFADGTDTTITNSLSDHSNYVWRGFRIFGAWLSGYPLPAFGHELTFTSVYQARERPLYFELALTNGQNYSPQYTGDFLTLSEPLVSLVDTRPNRLFFSKTGLPEEVPLTNYIDVGAGTILKTWPTQSALLCLCTDGLWRVTGDGTSWQVYQVDPTVTLLHPDCLTSLNNQIYGWVEDGLALIGEDGAKTISTDAVGQHIRLWATQLKDWGAPYFWGPEIAGDRFWNEIWLNVYRSAFVADGGRVGPDHVTTLVYNTDTKNFTRQQMPQFSSVVYSPDANRLISAVYIPGETPSADNVAVLVQSDFYTGEANAWNPCTIWFNPIQTDDKGKLKQFMDVVYFAADVERRIAIFDELAPCYMHGLFDARADLDDDHINDFTINTRNMVELSRDIHFWVPRRAVLSDQLQLGLQCQALLDPETVTDTHGFHFQLQGFSVRYRVASDTLKR